MPAASRGLMAALARAFRIPQIDGHHRRQLRSADTISEPAHRPLARQAAGEGFQRRRRRTEHERHLFRSGDPFGHVAGVVAPEP